MSYKRTNAIKGVFAVIILFSHMRGYIHLSTSKADFMFEYILNIIGQLMVVMYFFYSGYGIMESINKNANYMNGFLWKRIGKTLVHFDIAVLSYLLLMTVCGYRYPIINYFTCWIGATSVGNSNWFIFDILILYAILYLSISVSTRYAYNDKRVTISSVFMLTVLFWILLKLFSSGDWWYNTIIAFPFGMVYSVRKRLFTQMFRKYYHLLMGGGILFLLAEIKLFGVDEYGLCACVFALFIVGLTFKARIDNPVLQWLGTHSFAIYIMQRFPMNILRQFNINDNLAIFTLITLPSALLIAFVFQKIIIFVDKKFLKI